jgi:hypothetical protein
MITVETNSRPARIPCRPWANAVQASAVDVSELPPDVPFGAPIRLGHGGLRLAQSASEIAR